MQIHLSDELADLVETLRDAREVRKAAEAREKAARDALLEILDAQGATEAVTGSGLGVSVSVQNRRQVSSKQLEALFPEVYEQVTTEKQIRVLRVS